MINILNKKIDVIFQHSTMLEKSLVLVIFSLGFHIIEIKINLIGEIKSYLGSTGI